MHIPLPRLSVLLVVSPPTAEDSPPSPPNSPSSSSPSKPAKTKIPLPSFQGSVREGGEIPSVFQNPYQKAEEQRKAILEQHVKMTASLQEKEDEKKKRLPCFKFRKGQCHAGDKCRFWHDKQTVTRHQEKNNAEGGGGGGEESQPPVQVYAAAPKLLPPEPAFFQQETAPQPTVRDPLDDDQAPQQKKKRVGMASNLVPPKRAMTNLSEQRAKERPWTVGT